MVPSKKTPALSHMMWFFVIPIVGFLGWASYKFLDSALRPEPKDILSLIHKIDNARSSGDRWQVAYQLSGEIQKQIHSGTFEKTEEQEKDKIYLGLKNLLQTHQTDPRLKKYLVVTVGQMSDVRGLEIGEAQMKDLDPEVRFFAGWSVLQLLQKNPEQLSPQRLDKIAVWLDDPDASLRKIAATFLIQQQGDRYLEVVAKQLQDGDAQVRWNAAAALAAKKHNQGARVLQNMLTLENFRTLGFQSTKDLRGFVASVNDSIKASQDPELLQAVGKLKAQLETIDTPESRAIQAGFR